MVKPSSEAGAAGNVEVFLHADARGCLEVLDYSALPFAPRRMFWVSQVPQGEERGGHAHRECHQLFLVVYGRVRCLVDDGATRQEVTLVPGSGGLHLPPLTWGKQTYGDEGSVLVVLASHEYVAADYIHDYDEFVRAVAERGAAA